MNLNITTAQIYGIDEEPSWFEHRCFYAWWLNFTMSSYANLDHLLIINVGKTVDEVKDFFPTFRQKMKQVRIFDGQKVAIIFNDNGAVRAFAASGSNYWVDVKDKFKIKTFKEFGIDFEELKVY